MSASNRNARPFIFGLQGCDITEDEGRFFHEARPWGVILFARNIESRTQLRALTDSLRAHFDNPHLPILIDQEGGRVARVKPPLVPAYPAMGLYGEIYKTDPARAVEAARLGAALLAADLHALGINIACAPCLDLRLPGMSEVIGDRSFGEDVAQVVALGQAVLDGLDMGGVLPVIKHIPGHGRACVDSHHELPMINADIETLKRTDFEVFRRLNRPLMAMTGHLRFNAIDAGETSTFSKPVIGGVIRDYIGFDGLVMSDDISMRALSGDFAVRTRKAIKAGCDVVLHCNAERAEMDAIMTALPPTGDDVRRRMDKVNAALGKVRCSVPRGARKVWGELVADIFPEARNAL